MRGLSPEAVEHLARKDVALVEREAQVVARIVEEKGEWSVNTRGKLNIIAVVGPGQLLFSETQFEQVVLCEIGLWRTRPYHATQKLPKRRQWFKLTAVQYQLVAPTIFALLQLMVDKRVAGWKNGPHNPFYIHKPRNYFSFRQKRLFTSSPLRERIAGCRFGFARKDDWFLRDFYWNEFNSPVIIRQLRGLARMCDKMLRRYRLLKTGKRKSFIELKRVSEIGEILTERANGSL